MGRRLRVSRSLSAGLAFALVAGLLVGLPPMPVAAVAPDAPSDRSVPVSPLAASAQTPPAMPQHAPKPVAWPSAGSAVVAVSAPGARSAVSAVNVGGLPVRAAAAAAARTAPAAGSGRPGVTGGVASSVGENAVGPRPAASRGPAGQDFSQPVAAAEPVSQVKVEVLDRSVASAAGVDGLLLKVSRADGGTVPGDAVIDVDFSGFAGAYGADWAARLQLVAMPSCALTTPQVAACRRGTPVPSSKADTKTSRLSAQVQVNPQAQSAQQSQLSKSAADDSVSTMSGPQVFAVQSGQGAFAKTNLTTAASWSAGTQAGDFSWSYPMGVPSVPGGLAPQVGLNYSSGMVDGRTAVEGAQTSQIGEGFADINPGFVERSYRSCADDILQRVSLETGWNALSRFAPLADYDGDAAKRPDLVGVTANGEMWINFNTSKPGDPSKVGGTFVSGGWGMVTQFWPADLDGDGRTDLVGFDGSTVWLWRLIGAAGAAPVVASGTPLSFAGFNKILAPVDIDGDSKVDIAGVNGSGEMRYRKNTSTSGTVSFAGASMLVSAGWATVQHFFVADFDGDGRTDITGRDNDTYWVWLLSGAAGAVPTVTTSNFGGGWGVYSRFAPLLDYDRDNKPDIAGITANGELWVSLNTSTPGNVSRGGGGFVTAGWTNVDVLLAADFDGDSVNDLAGRGTDGTMWVWQGTGKPGLAQFGPFFYDATSDLCWRQPNATMLLGGKSVELVLDDATGLWKAADDSAAKIEQIMDSNGEYWKATTPDGTQYFFGMEKLPGWQAGDRQTWSRLAAPVFANHSSEPCFNGAGFGSSWCYKHWRWNLDYVVDVHGNTMSYWYGKETNNTGLFANPGAVAAYDRGSYLQRIEYGTRAGTGATRESAPGATPQAQVNFVYAERCWSNCWNGADPVAASWYDTPWDLRCTGTYCANNIAPSFWTAMRLYQINTQVRDAATSSYKDVDSWQLAHAYPATGDNTSPSLWLDTITHTGKAGTGPAITDPPVQFLGTAYQNRAHFDAGTVEPTYKYRITNVYNGTGGITQIYYDGVDCPAGAANTPDPDHNSQRCYPQYVGGAWTWWSKYRVGKVVDSDLVGGSPPVTTTYTYSTAGSSISELWAHNDAGRYSTKLANRSWSVWRGYSTVGITVGTVDGQKSYTSNLYMRGMNGDRVDGDNDGTRQASITTSDGAVLTDHQYLAGFHREAITFDGLGGQPLSKTINDPWWQETSRRALTPTWAIPPTSVGGYVRTASTTTKTWLPLSSSWRTTKTVTSFDSTYGLATQVDDLGDNATAADDRCTRSTYARNTTLWLLNTVSRAETVGVGCAQTAAYPADLVSDTRAFFDGSATHGTAPTRGLTTKVEQASSHNGATPSYVVTGETGYDNWGRVTSTKNALGQQTSTVFTHDAAGRPTKMETTNAAGHKVTTTLDPIRSVPLTVTDPNGKTTTGQYDANGRMIKTWEPGHPTSGTPDSEYVYAVSASAPSYVQAKVLGPNGNQISSFEIFDGMLRLRQVQVTAADGKRSVADTQYNDRGLPVKTSAFYNSASAPSSTLVGFNDVDVDTQTRASFDQAGRQVSTALWSRNVKKHETTTKYEGDRSGVIPPSGGTVTQEIVDGRGRVVEKRQYQSATGYTGAFDKTLYTYDDADRLLTVKDPADNAWTYEYDLLGRKTKTIDPDAGMSTSTFDNAGQVLSTTDSRGQKLFFEYDILGRTTKRRADSTSGTVLADWTYDTVAKGQLTSTRRYDGATTYTSAVTSFDDGYRPLSTTFTAPGFGTSGSTLTYTVTNTYKANGALATQALPAVGGLPAETITHTYSDTGLSLTMSSGQATYVAATSYLYDGLVSQQTFGTPGKQVKQTSTYDAATRQLFSALTALESSPGVFSAKFEDTYGYDAVGNMLSVAGKTDGVADQEECFRYDYLRRLTEAWTQTSGACSTPQRTGADPYWRKWTFDSVGNRLTQTDKDATDTTWTYQVGSAGGVKPHQVKKIDAVGPKAGTALRTFGYDAAGNTTSRTTEGGAAQTLTWDKEGHLASVAEAGVTTSYVYDSNGLRLVGKNPSKSTLYLPDGTELEKIGTSNPLGQRYYGVAVRDASGLKWIISNHQGTGTAQIDSVTLAANRRRSMPYGEPRGTQPTWLGTKGFVSGTKDDTGLTHLGAREYDPGVGRFISVDPIMSLGDVQSWHGYAYSGNSPITFSDPSGLARPNEGGGPPIQTTPGCYGGNLSPSCGGDKRGEETPKIVPIGDQTLSDDPFGVTVQTVMDTYGCDAHSDCHNGWRKGKTFEELPLMQQADVLWRTFCINNPDVCEQIRKDQADAMHAFMLDVAKELSGFNDAKACANGTASGCIWTAVGFVPFAKAKAVFKLGKLGAALSKALKVSDESASLFKAFCSFSGDTPVLLADGTSKPISEIKVGDEVLATDPETGEQGPRAVTHLWLHGDELVKLSLQNGHTITTTEDHPFWNVTDQGWQRADELDAGDGLRTHTGATVTVEGIVAGTEHNDDAYNLTVNDLHTYYVLAGNTPVLVHNTGPTCGPGEINVNDLKFSQTVENHLGDMTKQGIPTRPFMKSPLTMQEIMRGSTPAPDPGGVPGAWRWDTPGALNGKSGTWELVVDTTTNTVLHYNFTTR